MYCLFFSCFQIDGINDFWATIQMLKNGDCGGPLWKTDRFFLAAGKAQASGCKTIESKTTLKQITDKMRKIIWTLGRVPKFIAQPFLRNPFFNQESPTFALVHFAYCMHLFSGEQTLNTTLPPSTTISTDKHLEHLLEKNQFTRVEMF